MEYVSCYNIPSHFASNHGITRLSRETHILCEWDCCWKWVLRHNWVRHLREKHLHHPR
ncbi:hypothetical protein ID866_10459 [Astraeus odoratus]|nr:hypothetical protein ID866_10459 [Astraeus odoratus]